MQVGNNNALIAEGDDDDDNDDGDGDEFVYFEKGKGSSILHRLLLIILLLTRIISCFKIKFHFAGPSPSFFQP